MLNTMTKNRLSPTLMTPPQKRKKSGRLVSPMARSMPAPKSYTISAGIPAKTMRI